MMGRKGEEGGVRKEEGGGDEEGLRSKKGKEEEVRVGGRKGKEAGGIMRKGEG